MQDEQLDRMLDEALASYSSKGPRPGLEDRVLAHVRAEAGRRRIPRWVFALPALAAAMVMIAIFSRPAPQPPPLPVPLVKQAFARAPETPAAKAARRATPVRAAKRVLPKRQVFPTPVPLTNEERALLVFAQRYPEQARALFTPPPEPKIEPIRIEEIRIEPLEMDGPEQEN